MKMDIHKLARDHAAVVVDSWDEAMAQPTWRAVVRSAGFVWVLAASDGLTKERVVVAVEEDK